MPETVTFEIAGRPVEIVLEDRELLPDVLGRVEGFRVAPTKHPWMRIHFNHIDPPAVEPSGPTPLQVTVLDDDSLRLWVPSTSCHLRFGSPHLAAVDACDLFSFFIYVAGCFSLAFPREHALVLHSDTVEWRDGALAFFGPSGTGKTTAATQLTSRTGARPLGTDRNVLEVRADGRPVVHTLPRLQRIDPCGRAPDVHQLTGLIFPDRGAQVEVRPLSKLEGFTRLLESVVMPSGRGVPMSEVMSLVDRTLSWAWIAEMYYELGRDFTTELGLVESRV